MSILIAVFVGFAVGIVFGLGIAAALHREEQEDQRQRDYLLAKGARE